MTDSESPLLERDSLRILRAALDRLETGFAALPPMARPAEDAQAIERTILEVADRLKDNYP